MVVTPNPSQSHPTLHVPSTEPRHPPVLNVRRPRTSQWNAATADGDIVLATVVEDAPLPPTVLRLPNLGVATQSSTRARSIASIAHWVAIGLGSLIALWLIFGGRRGAMPEPEAVPGVSAPARADAAPAAPVWVPPPLESAGESTAPAWTPPAASAAPAAPVAAPAATSAENIPAATTPLETPAATSPNEPQQESWPRPSESAPELPAAGTSAQAAPPASPSGPALRTAQLEPHVDSVGASAAGVDPAASEVQPLEVTVPVPQ